MLRIHVKAGSLDETLSIAARHPCVGGGNKGRPIWVR